MQRIDLAFTCQGQRCDAWLYLPASHGPHPAIIIAHGIGAIRQVRLAAYAERFTKAGFAVLTFDYRHWGTSEGAPRFVCDIPSQLADIHAAIDFAATLPEIDPAGLALFGTSFGGGHALTVAAQRADLCAVISQCAVVDCLATALRSPKTLALRWIAAGITDQARAWLGLPPKYIQLAGAPGDNALMTAANAEARYRAMLDGPSPWENKIAARLVNVMPFYRPITQAHKIAAPLLMVVCDRDEVCPPTLAAKSARLAPKGRAAHFDSGHFDIYFDELFEAATTEMIEFLEDAVQACAGTPTSGSATQASDGRRAAQ